MAEGREGRADLEKQGDGMSKSLDELLKKSVAAVDAMTPEEREAMYEAHKKSWVRAEMSWPKPKFKWVNGCKVYESYEDYVND